MDLRCLVAEPAKKLGREHAMRTEGRPRKEVWEVRHEN
jgi:hypothetical protein